MSTDHNDRDLHLDVGYHRKAAHDMAALEQVEELKVKKDNDMLRHIKNMRRFWHQG